MADDDGLVTLEFTVRHALILSFVVGLFAGGFFVSAISGFTGATGAIIQDNQPSDAGGDPSPSAGDSPAEDTIDPGQISLEGQPTLGEEDAPVTLVAYEDFECPFCQRFEQNAMEDIKSNYVESGQVKVVWKDFPLTQLHPWAKPAAVAMECVYRQDEGAFWALNERVFDNQDTLAQGSAQDTIKQWASEEGVSASAVQSCIDSGDARSEVESDMSEGRNLGVSGTPTVFVNGQKIVGAQPYSAFEQVINSELS